MNRADFKALFDRFNPIGAFSVDEWDNAIESWTPFYQEITSPSGLSIDRWLKNKRGYLPDFLDTKEKKFGHARIGNYDQVRIYQYTGKDASRNGKYTDIYAGRKDIENIDEIRANYETNIQSLLKDVASATSLNAIYNLEKSSKYKAFTSSQLLRKISVLCSLMDSSPYPHAFMWFFNQDAQNKLAEVLGVKKDSNKTFLEFNHEIYETAKDYAGITGSANKEDYIKLYYLLLFLSDTSFNTEDLSDFKNGNIIFNGAPGTGKTYGVLTGIKKLRSSDPDKQRLHKYVQFHPSFSYQDFIEGIKPMGITADGNINLKVVNGIFKDFCIYVKKENEAYYKTLAKKPTVGKPSEFNNWPHYYFVVDEINRGNLSNIFGETFTLLEADYRDYDFSGVYTDVEPNLVSTVLSNVVASTGDDQLIYKKIGNDAYFGVPFNIHFIGIMNDVDKSIDAFDLALRRRFKWIAKNCDYDVIQDVLLAEGYDPCEVEDYKNACESLNKYICNDGLGLGSLYEIGHAFFLKMRNTGGRKEITQDKKKAVFNNYIVGTLTEYIRLIAEETQIEDYIKDAKKAFGI